MSKYDDIADQMVAEAKPPAAVGTDLGVTEPVPAGLVATPLRVVRAPGQSAEPAAPSKYDAIADEMQSEQLDPFVAKAQAAVEENASKTQQMGALMEAARMKFPLQSDVDNHAAVKEIARQTGKPAQYIEDNLPAWRAKMATAQDDPAKFRAENPTLSELLLARPDVAPIAFHDTQLNPLARVLRGVKDIILDRGEIVPTLEPGEDFGQGKTEAGEPIFETPTGRKILRDGHWVEQSAAQNVDLGPGELAKIKGDPLARTRGFQIVKQTFEQGMQQVEYGQLGAEIMDRQHVGEDAWEIEKKVVDLEQKMGPKWFGQGPIEQLFLDAAEILPTQVQSYKGAGKAAVLGAAVAGGVTYAVTRSPAAARAAALKGAATLAPAGVFISSYNQERGSQFLQYRKTKTDDGLPIGDDAARGAAYLYGVLAAGVETSFFGASLKMFGPAGDAMAAGTGKAFFAGLMRDRGARAILADVGRRWAGGALAEAKEEGIQNLIGDAIGYMAKVIKASEGTGGIHIQSADVAGSLEDAALAAYKAGVGTAVLGVAGAGSTILTNAWARDRAHANGQKVEALAQVAESSSTVRAAPEVVAELVRRETEKQGEAVTHVYVDAQAFSRLFQEGGADAGEAATQLMGEKGAQTLKEALAGAHDGKIEVPVVDYLDKWGGKKVATALAQDTTVRPGMLSLRQQVAQDEEITTRRKELIDEYQKENAPAPESEAEKRLVDAVGVQLARTGIAKPAEARKMVALTRAVLRTQAEVGGVDPDVLFSDYALTVERETADAARSPAALNQEAAAKVEPPMTEGALQAKYAALSPEEQTRRAYIDPGTGVQNERAFRARPHGAFVWSGGPEGIKYGNKAGHEIGDAIYSASAHAFVDPAPDVAKVKGDFAGDLLATTREEAQAQLDAILARANENMPAKGFRITGAIGSTLAEAEANHIALKAGLEKAGERSKRGRRPKGLPTRDFATFMREVFNGPPPDVVGARLDAVKDTVIGDSLQAVFKATPEDQMFRAIHYDEKTGFLSRQGFQAVEPKAHVVSLDLNKLKKINLLFGEAGGDALLKAFADAVRELGATGFAFAHFSGDEYAAMSDDPALLQAWIDDLGEVCDNVSVKMPDGTILKGITFGYGIGTDYGTADTAVEGHKRKGVGRERKARLGRDRRRGDTDRRTLGGKAERATQGGVREGRREGESQATAVGPRLAQGERGYVDRMQSGLKKIFKVVLTDKADLSTFLHESSHVFLDVMADLAKKEGAASRLTDDWARTLEWLGVKDGSEITVEHHEKWAKAFETYLKEGKAPSAALVGAFQRFKLWLQKIYGVIAPGEIDDEIRGVFDRMLATDAEIDRQKRGMGVDRPIFRSPEEAGMAPAEFQSYLDDREKAFTSAAQATQRRVIDEKIKATETYLKAERQTALVDAGKEYDALPASQAVSFLKDGQAGENAALKALLSESGEKVGLDANAVSDAVGEEALKTTFKGMTEAGGLHPDELAEIVGAPDGETLLKAIASRPDKIQWSTGRAEELLRQRAPDVIAEKAKLEEAAANALHNQGSADWLLKEWQALRARRGEGQGAAPLESIRLAAGDIVEGTQTGALYPGRVLQAERSAANRAFDAAAKQNWKLAAVEKQKQLLNHYIYRETVKALEDRAKFEKLADKLTDRKRREALGKAGKSFLDAADSILEVLGFAEPTTDPAVLQDRKTTPEWMAALEEQGILPAFAGDRLSALLAPGQVDPGSLSVGDMRMIHTALAQLWTAARDVNQVMLLGKRVQIDTVLGNIAQESSHLAPRPQAPASDSQRSVSYRLGQFVSGINAVRTDPELMLRQLGETSRRFFWDRYIDQRTAEDNIGRHVLKFFLDKWDALPKELQRAKHDLLPASELESLPYPADIQRDGSLRDRAWMYMVALNMGNRSNMERLLGGYAWGEDAVRAFLDKNMKPQEWDFVEGVWALLDKELYPHISAAFEATNGIKPEKIEALPFTLSDGRVVSGGYFPARYDPIASRLGANQREEALSQLYNSKAGQYSITKGFTKERAKTYEDVVNLQWNEVPRHIGQVIHYVAFDGYIRDAGRVMAGLQDTVSLRLGQKYYPQLEGWLRTVASPVADASPEHLGDVMKALGEVRSRFVLSTLGYSITVAAGDLTNTLIPIASGRLKSRFAIPAHAQVMAHWLTMRPALLEMIPELKHRSEQLKMHLRRGLAQVGPEGRRSPFIEGVRDSAWYLMEAEDSIASTIIAKGAYEQAMAPVERGGQGMSHEDAVKEAGSVVRSMLPTQDPAEQPAILRDKRGVGSLVAFCGYFLKLYNIKKEAWAPAVQEWMHADTMGEKVSTLPTWSHAAARVLAVTVVANVIAELFSGRGPEKDEDWSEWAARKTAGSAALNVPVLGQVGEGAVNELADYAWGRKGRAMPSVRASPALSAADMLERALKKSVKADADPEERIFALLQALGIFTKFPIGTSQMTRTGKYVAGGGLAEDAAAGRPLDVLGGVGFGRRDQQSKNPFSVMQDILNGESP